MSRKQILWPLFVSISFALHVNPWLPALAGSNDAVAAHLPDPFQLVDKKLVGAWLKAGEYLPVSEIRPGMEGYGLSVFQGTKPERFNVKIIGVVKRVLNGRDAILARLSGPLIGKNSVIRGMSGSPVYLNNKVIGAISYGFDFSTEPIAGITPIADMLDALEADTKRSEQHRIGQVPADAGGVEIPMDKLPTMGSAGSMHLSSGAPHLVPLMAPVSLAGFSERAQLFLSERLKSHGLWVSSGSAGALDPDLAARTKQGHGHGAENLVPPGGALSVMLSTGDFNSSACGTATMTFGNHVLAFGHPFLQAGAVDFPMATAFVHQILPNLSVSFKVSSPLQIIGAFLADRPWSVGGQIGRSSKLIPATYSVVDQTRHIKRIFRCQVVDHPELTPELVAATAMSAIDATHQSSGPYILKVKSAIDADRIGIIERLDRYSGNLRNERKLHIISDPVASFLMGTTSKILDNDFEKTSIKSVNLEIELEDGHNTAKIERIYVNKPIVAPGESVKVNCVLRPYNQQPITKTLSLQVPRNVPDGPILLGVSSGDDIDVVRKRMGLVDPTPENLGQIAKKIRDAGSGDDLTVVMALPEQSIMINGVVLPNPPAHWTKLFYSDRYTRGPALVKSEVRTSEPEDWLIDGSHIMTVEVRRPDKAMTKAAPYAVSVHGALGASDGIYITDLAKKTMDSSSRKTDSKEPSSSSGSAEKSTSQSTAFWTASKEYPHMRSLQVWSQENQADFMQGKSDSTTIDSWGRISPALQSLSESPLQSEMRIWSAACARTGYWFATADTIYFWNGEQLVNGSNSAAQLVNAPKAVAKLNSVIIPALVADSRGKIYAANVPNGEIVAITPAKKEGTYEQHTVAKLSEKIITALSIDDEDNLYIGTAGTGRVYKLPLSSAKKGTSTDAKPTLLFDSGQADVTSIFYCQTEKRLYVGTAEKGDVYSLDAKGKVRAEYQSSDHIVTGVAKDSKGDLYIATAGQGHLIKIAANGTINTLATSEAFYTLVYDPVSDHVYSGDAEGDITEARTDALSRESYFVPVCHTEQEAVLALATDGHGRLFAGTSNLAVARAFAMTPSTGASYTSIVKDGQRQSRWSRVRVFGAYNEVSESIAKAVKLETRTGETSQPDLSWAPWQEATYASGAYKIASPVGRYLQYRMQWRLAEGKKGEAQATPPVSVGKVEVTYLPSNVPPEFSSVSIKTGAAYAGKQDVSVSANDSDGDNLSLSIQISRDGAETWQTVASDLRTSHSSSKTTAASKTKIEKKEGGSAPPAVQQEHSFLPSPSSSLSRSVTELPRSEKPTQLDNSDEPKGSEPRENGGKDDSEKDKEKDKDKETSQKDSKDDKKSASKEKDKSTKEATASSDHVKVSDSTTAGEKFSWNWDTSKLKDGSYVVKLVLNDIPSNPSNSLQTVALRTIDIDNTAPEILSVELARQRSGQKALLNVRARDKQTPIANAIYRFDDSEPFAMGNDDQATDGLDAEFSVKEIEVPRGSHKLEVQVTDKAGNTATKTVPVK